MPDTKRETLTRLYDAAQKTGVTYLLAIVTLGSATVKELRVLTRDSEPTVNKTLIELETRGLAQRAGGGKADRWFPSALCAQLFHQKLFGERPARPLELETTDRPCRCPPAEPGRAFPTHPASC